MGRVKELLHKIKNGWSGLSKAKKYGIIIILCSLIIAMIIYYFVFGRVEYVPIFTNLDIEDSAEIVKALDERKITDYKVEDDGATILVPEDQVGKLRLDLAIDGVLPNGEQGFELFDNTDHAMTDEDREILYQRALQGELEKSIKSLEEVEDARVHLTLSEKTVFTKEEQPASASIMLDLRPTKELSPEQIKGIISLVSGAVKNLPKENIQVVDSQANLLSTGIINENEDSSQSSGNTNQHMETEQKFEKNLENDLKKMLEQTFGVGKVLVKINADFNFDSKETTVISYDPEAVIRSQQVQINQGQTGTVAEGDSPIDNNTQNYVDKNVDTILEEGGVKSYDSTTNNEIGESTTHTVRAPGEVERLSTSVVYDGTLTPETQQAMENIVIAATGYNIDRGDMINVEGVPFDTSYQDQMQEEMKQEEARLAEQKEARNRAILYGAIAAGVILAALIVVAVILHRKRKEEEVTELPLIDTQIDEPIPVQEIKSEPVINIEAEESTEEKSIKDYAQKNPEKMAELLRAWMTENER